jgi:hypothetical protein
MSDSIPYSRPGLQAGQSNLLHLGGALSIGGGLLGLFIFVLSCFGLSAALVLSPLPLLLGSVGLVLSIVGGIFKAAETEDTHVLAALFISFFTMMGGLLELAAWRGWTIIPKV